MNYGIESTMKMLTKVNRSCMSDVNVFFFFFFSFNSLSNCVTYE